MTFRVSRTHIRGCLHGGESGRVPKLALSKEVNSRV